MQTLFDRIETFLRVDRMTTKSDLMRARAVYMMGMAFIATQIINLGTMYYSYGLSFDHIVSLVVCLFVGSTILLLRYNANFRLYAVIYSVLIVAGTMSSALNQNTGINSALIPFFVLGAIVNGFICGWRSTILFGMFSVMCIWALWFVSTLYDYTPIFDVEKFSDRNFQRAVQASLSIILITMVGAFFSKNMHEAFGELEAGIVAAQDSDKAKTDFLATMSHELFTPMNGIIGMNDALEDTNLDADQRELTAIIRDSGHDLKMIIGNVLLFSQLEAERVNLDDSVFNISGVLKDTVKFHAANARRKGLAFKAHMSPTVPELLIGDKARTSQIVCAILDNAVKFTDEGAVELYVDGQADDNGRANIAITVTDTGIGVASEDSSRIFERFTQQDGSIKRRHGGTGLGLTISQGLAQLMGGDIKLESEFGVGSQFIIHLQYDVAQTEPVEMLAAAE